ncbi:MAG: sigma-54 dependent transcriptional regulator [Pseudomonadota bacterium]
MQDEAHIRQTTEPAGADFGSRLHHASVLIVDDEEGMRHFLQKTLAERCSRVDATADTEEASKLLDQQSYSVIILDNIMPGQTGLEWLADQQRIGLHSDIILMTAYADLETAIAAIRAGASDFLLKPFRSNQVLNAVSKSLAKTELRRQNSVLRHELEAGSDILRQRDTFVGSSPATNAVREAIRSAGMIDAHVVIQGEPGTGQQIAARMLHTCSSRRERPFIGLQCYGLSEAEFRAKLFGHVGRTGSSQGQTDGILHDAYGGTLYLEDVDLLNPACQNVLTELLSTGRFQPIGGGRSFQSDVRVVCSSTSMLREAVDTNRFRPDLYYILNVQEVSLPPLRERPSDIVEIAEFLLMKLSARMGVAEPKISATERRKIMAYDWPGNVMELRNVVERAIIQGSFERALQDVGSGEVESLAAVEQRHILNVLEACEGNRAEAARRLGVARKTIDRKCQAWGL